MQDVANGPLSRNALISRLIKYGFIECDDALIFLQHVSDAVPDRSAYGYIRDKVKLCLQTHDNGSEYFIELRQLAEELDYVLLE